jgi:hypothetical protein
MVTNFLPLQDIEKLNRNALSARLVCGSCTKYQLFLSKTQHGVDGPDNSVRVSEESITKVFFRTFTFQVHATDRPFWFTLDGESNYFLKLDPLSHVWESNCKISPFHSEVNLSNRHNVTFNEMWTEIAMWASEVSLPDVCESEIPLNVFLRSSNTDSARLGNLNIMMPNNESANTGTLSKARSCMAKDSVYRFVLPDGTCRLTSTSI